MVTFVRNCLVKITLRMFQPLSVVKTMVPTLLRQFRRSLHIKKIISNAPCLLYLAEQQNIAMNNSEKSLVTGAPPTQLKKLQKLYRKRSNNYPMVSFIHSGSEITTWMEYNFKTKSTKSKATFLRSQAVDHQIKTRTLELYANSLYIFIAACLKKTYLAVHFTKGCFLTDKLWI